MNELDKVIKVIGTQAKLARKLGLTTGHISYWRRNGVPLYWAVPIEKATNGVVSREDIRPDFFGPGSILEDKQAPPRQADLRRLAEARTP